MTEAIPMWTLDGEPTSSVLDATFALLLSVSKARQFKEMPGSCAKSIETESDWFEPGLYYWSSETETYHCLNSDILIGLDNGVLSAATRHLD